jgi:hypothetical protein
VKGVSGAEYQLPELGVWKLFKFKQLDAIYRFDFKRKDSYWLVCIVLSPGFYVRPLRY